MKDSQGRSSFRQDMGFLSLILAIASLGCGAFVLFRFMLTDRPVYFFLFWNLFLAWVPYLLALVLMTLEEKAKSRALRLALGAPLGALWLLFFPNSPYIFTDFIHLINRSFVLSGTAKWLSKNAVIWYDVIMTSAFAFLGLFLGLISLYIVHGLARRLLGKAFGWILVAISCLLSGFGIFVGRFIGLNSWDIFVQPFETIDLIAEWAFTPRGYLFGLTFAFFIAAAYVTLYVFKKVDVMRHFRGAGTEP